jgi:hypothetical protein
MKQGIFSDFWWFATSEMKKYKYLRLMHQVPYSDEPNSEKQPYSVRTFHSIDANGCLSEIEKYYTIDFINQWQKKCANINIFRSLSLLYSRESGEELLGPFVIDIDRQECSKEGYKSNLDKAFDDTRKLFKVFLCDLETDDFRIFFSGHKGFNIEIRPKALGITPSDNQWSQFRNKRLEINSIFGENFIDTLKEHVRLHDSINRWIANDGKEVNRMKFELSLHELNGLDVEDICTRSERLALDYLSKQEEV